MKKANYRNIASNYDSGRHVANQNLAIWLQLISQIVGDRKNVKLLDLGCGTGRFSIPIATKLKYTVVGADNSKEMLQVAEEKDKRNKVIWDYQKAPNLSYLSKEFDVVFMSHLLHHLDDPLETIRECFRVLQPGGVLINRYGAIEDIIIDPEHYFFPQAIELDRVRTPSKKQVEKWFKQAGFININSSTSVQRYYKSPRNRLKRIKQKYTSVLTLISKTSFQQGLAKIEKHLLKHPHERRFLIDKITLTNALVPKKGKIE